MSLEELKQKLHNFGVAGAGGAGFPTYAKLNSKTDTIILNCAECEPLLKLHQQVLATYAYEILSALSIVAETVGAKQIIVALKKNYKDAINAVNAVLNKFEHTKISYLPEVYPAGDEIITIYETTGRVVPPGDIPISVGVTVFNVETALNIYYAVFENKPVTHKYVTISGAVKNPITLKAPLGITFRELIDMAGGPSCEDYAVISGGPMMGKLSNPLDTVTKTTNGILVFPEDHIVVKTKKTRISLSLKRAMGTCCQCRACTATCPRNLLGHPIEPHAFMRSATSGDTKNLTPFINTLFCSGCGLCELYSCPQGLSPRTLISEYKTGLKANGVKVPNDIVAKNVNKHRNMKLVPISRLTARLGLTKYDKSAILSEKKLDCSRLRISLRQNIGVPCTPNVKAGQKISENDIIAYVDESKLGLMLHSPVNGKVIDANEHFILIECNK